VTEDYLIKTDLKVGDAQGFKAGDVTYPKGSLQKFAFSKDKALNVYTDSVTLRVPITVAADAPTGPQHVALKLRYQACSNEICLPPVTLPVDAAINVVADRKDAHTANAAVFAH
jgi:Disulphide bond corrector protein DsbC